MLKGIMDNGGLLIEAGRCFSVINENSTNACTYASLSFLLKHCKPKSGNDYTLYITINQHNLRGMLKRFDIRAVYFKAGFNYINNKVLVCSV